jgi:hypothetical protein
VVFASTYRFTVLFSYSSADPTYTLAPTVGWTSIEMSAGIVSACLPTLGPVFAAAARKIGIKGSVLRTRGTNNDSDKGQFSTGRSAGDRSDLETAKPKKSPTGTFYRLSDDNSRIDGPPDAGLRPDHRHEYTVTSAPGNVKGEGDSLSGDEIPLQGIRVRTDFKHSEMGRE